MDIQKLLATKRWVYVATTLCDEDGYIPSIAIEGVKGHFPLTGQGRGSTPWYWGKTYEECSKTCDKVNQEMGYSLIEAIQIVASSMR